MRGFKKAVVAISPLPKDKNGYFNLKNARNSSLKRVTSKVKTAINILNISILDSSYGIPPLSQKNKPKKNPPLVKEAGYPIRCLNFVTPLIASGLQKLYQKILINIQKIYKKAYK